MSRSPPAHARDDSRLLVMDRRGSRAQALAIPRYFAGAAAAVPDRGQRHAGLRGPPARAKIDRRRGRISTDAPRFHRRGCTAGTVLVNSGRGWRGASASGASAAAASTSAAVSRVEIVERRAAGPRAAADLPGPGAVAARRARRRSARCRCRRTSKRRARRLGDAAPAVDERSATRPCSPRARARSRRRPRACTSRPSCWPRCDGAGHEIAAVTLHVGPGTFRPVESDDPREHRLHPERYRIPAPAAAAIARARARGPRRGRGRARPWCARSRRRRARSGGDGRGRATARPISSCCPATASAWSRICSPTSTCRARRCWCWWRRSPGARRCWPPTARRSSAATASTATATRC